MNTLKNDTSRNPDRSKTADFSTSLPTCKPIDYGLLKPRGLHRTSSIRKAQSSGPSVIEPSVNQITHLSLHTSYVTSVSNNTHLLLTDRLLTGAFLKRYGQKSIRYGLFTIHAGNQKHTLQAEYMYNIFVLYLFSNIHLRLGTYSLIVIFWYPCFADNKHGLYQSF